MDVLFWIFLASLGVSLLGLIGVLFLSVKQKFLDRILLYLVSLSIGGLIGGAFLHLIPESVEEIGIESAFIFVIVGFMSFLFLEKILHWRHCHEGKCEHHSFAYMNLFGDGVHNFIDGLIIAGSFLVDMSVGFATTLAIVLHEIPQELGDFGVLVYAGFTKKKAILYNFLIALTALVGAGVGILLFSYVDFILVYLLAFAAGGFIYIGASDLVPEIRKEMKFSKALINFLFVLIGLLLMYLLVFLE